MPKILIVEDELETGRAIKSWLTNEHCECELVTDAAQAKLKLNLYAYDLILLDWKLPGITGLEFLKTFRARGGTTPVLMLTAKGEIVDRTTGLDSGADDYLTKPFDGSELISRVRALLRRPSTYLGNDLKVGDIVLNEMAHRVTRSGEEIQLLPKEFMLLHFFMAQPSRVFSLDHLLKAVWSDESTATHGAVTSCIQRLRQKIDVEGKPSLIRSVYGVGYKLEGDDN
jgi:DNA-binding response OmpR family regulator